MPSPWDDNPDIHVESVLLASRRPELVLGVGLIEILVMMFSLGVLSCQTYLYFATFSHDSVWIRRLVALLVVLSIAQCADTLAVFWGWVVTHFGDWRNVVDLSWPVWTFNMLTQLTASSAQLFYAHRCYHLTNKNKIVVIFIGFGMLGAIAMCTCAAVQFGRNSMVVPTYSKFVVAEQIINVAVDLFITTLISWRLIRSGQGVNKNTEKVLVRLHRLTWATAAPPALSAVVGAIVFVAVLQPYGAALFTLFNVLTARLYVFAVLTTLNSRSAIRDTLNEPPQGSTFQVPHDPSQTNTAIVFAPTSRYLTMGIIDEHVEGGSIGGPAATSEADLRIDLDQWDKGSLETRTESERRENDPDRDPEKG